MDSYLFRLIMYIAIVAWLIPPIRQFKQSLYKYFLVLALTDPIGIILGKLLQFPPYLFYNFSSIVLLFSVFEYKNINKKIIISSIILLIISYLASKSPNKYTFYFIIFINFLILLIFLKRTLLFVIDNSLINIFHMILLLYQTTSILKMLSVVENFSSGVYYYAITNIFQILIAIFFSIFTENDKRLYFNIKSF
ncbi:MAG: hypothetical protein N2321_03860 [Melioribacteraceae bacterium]|nr:hypothetical protein [Melioribacteraceae bacterium]